MFPIAYKGNLFIRKVTTEREVDKRKPQNRLIIDNHINSKSLITNVDFVPSFCRKSKSSPFYHDFSSLMCLANEWLCTHSEWQLLNCETMTKWSNQKVDGVDYSAVVNSLRIWIKRESINDQSKSKRQNQIHPIFWYHDFVPEISDSHTDSLDTLINRINCALNEGKINGKILQIQTIKCPATANWSFNSGTTYCDDGQTSKDINRFPNYVLILRIYFKLGSQSIANELIVADFLPFYSPNCEDKFSSLIDRASNWLKQNYQFDFCNAQSVDILIAECDLNAIDTRSICKCKSKSDKEIRFLRIYCTRQNDLSKLFCVYESLSANCLDYKLSLTAIAFHGKNYQQDIHDWYKQLVQLTGDDGKLETKSGHNENLSSTASIISTSGGQSSFHDRIINIETIVVPPFVNKLSSFQYSVDKTDSCNQLEGRLRYSFTAIRVYYNESDLIS